MRMNPSAHLWWEYRWEHIRRFGDEIGPYLRKPFLHNHHVDLQ